MKKKELIAAKKKYVEKVGQEEPILSLLSKHTKTDFFFGIAIRWKSVYAGSVCSHEHTGLMRSWSIFLKITFINYGDNKRQKLVHKVTLTHIHVKR